MRAAVADMAPDKMALVPSDSRQISPPREPDVSEIDSGQKKRNADSLFLTQKVSRSGEGRALSPLARRHHRTRSWTRGPADATRATYTTDRNGASSRIRTPRASPRPRPRAPPPEFRNDFRHPVTTRVSNPKNTAFRPRIDLVVAPPFLRLRARRASKGRSPTTIPPPPVALSSSCSSSTTTAAASTFSTTRARRAP